MKRGQTGPRMAVGRNVLAGCLSLAFAQASHGTLPAPATGANVDESRVQKTLYVDPAHTEAADDDKHGAADTPFATLGFACHAAASAKDANLGVKIVLAAGTYREAAEIPPPANGATDTDAPLVIEAAEREQAVIDGADTEGWSPSTWKVEDTRWTHPWPFRRSAATHPAGLPVNATGESYRRGDLVFINGIPLRQVNTAADLAPGCFWGMLPPPAKGRRGAAESGGNAGPVAIVEPPPDTEPAGAIIQVGVRAHGLTIIGRRNVVVRGLLIQHAAEPGGMGEETAGVVLDHCANVLVEDVLSQWNDGVGLMITGGGSPGTDFTLRRVRLLHNGSTGLFVFNVKNLLAEDDETSFNNFRGEWAGWINPNGPAGAKIERVQGSTWRRQHVIGNACRGMWWAGGDTDLTVEDAVVRNNALTGLFVENDPGPVSLRRCLVAGTKGDSGAGDHATVPVAGLALASTPDVTLESNVFAGNATAQLDLGEPSSRAERHVYRHNVFYSADANLYRMPVSEGEMRSGFASYYATLDSQANCFWTPAKTEGIEGYSYRAPNRKTGAVYLAHPFTLEDWQAAAQKETGPANAGNAPTIEVGSLWEDPRFVDPLEGDYRLKKSSPVADWDLPSDEAGAGQ